jgi:PKD repeat protein
MLFLNDSTNNIQIDFNETKLNSTITSFGYINSTNVAYINNTNIYTKLQNFTANITIGRFKFYDNGSDLIIE